MRDLDFIIPSALVDPSLAPELLRDVRMPHLAGLLARAEAPALFAMPSHAPLTTWQAWVFAHRAGVDPAHVNLAELWSMACGMPPRSNGGRWLLEPAHFRIAKDHLRLSDPRDLAITIAEARTLTELAEPVLAEAGWQLDPLEPATLTHWLVSRRDGVALSAAAIERAIGDNVAAWQPRTVPAASDAAAAGATVADPAALAWRRCVNEIQMLWFGHPVNEAREAAGRQSVNTAWLSGNGLPRSVLPHYAAIDSSLPLLAALPIEPDASRTLESFDGLVAPAQEDDWSTWRDTLAALDARVGALRASQAAGGIDQLTLSLCGRDRVRSVTLRRGDTKRFWRAWRGTPSLAQWFAEEDEESPEPRARA